MRVRVTLCDFGKGLHEAICILLDAMPAKAKKKKLVLEPKPSAGDCTIAGRTIMYGAALAGPYNAEVLNALFRKLPFGAIALDLIPVCIIRRKHRSNVGWFTCPENGGRMLLPSLHSLNFGAFSTVGTSLPSMAAARPKRPSCFEPRDYS